MLSQTEVESSTVDNARTLDPYQAVAVDQPREFYVSYFSSVVLVELRVRQAEWVEAQRRDFYARYFTGVVLPELLDSPIFDQLEREPPEAHGTEEVDWDYYSEVILPALSVSYSYGEATGDPLELRSPVVVDWGRLERLERAIVSDMWETESDRQDGIWAEDMLDQNPDFFESWSP